MAFEGRGRDQRGDSDDTGTFSVAPRVPAANARDNTMSDLDETRTVGRRRKRSLFITLGGVGLVVVLLGRCSDATSQLPNVAAGPTSPPIELEMAAPTQPAPVITFPPTTTTTTRPAVPARPSVGCAHPTGSQASGVADVSLKSHGKRGSYLRTIPISYEPAPRRSLSCSTTEPGILARSSIRARWGEIAQLRHLVVVAPRWTARG